MSWKIFLRPVGLPVFLLSLVFLFLPFTQVVAVAGALFYAGAVYWAYQRERNKALPPGTEDEVGKLPYRRRKLANLAIAAARDIERRLATLPKDFTERLPLTAAEAGRLAAAVVYYLRREAEAQALAKAGSKNAEKVARDAGANAERTFTKVQELQTALTGLALADVTVDRDALLAQAEEAATEIKGLTRAVAAAQAELGARATPALEGEKRSREGAGKD